MNNPGRVGPIVSDNNRVGAARDPAYLMGVDYGTSSGRAVVVRVSDGAELGSAVRECRHGVIGDGFPGSGATLPPASARRPERIQRGEVAR